MDVQATSSTATVPLPSQIAQIVGVPQGSIPAGAGLSQPTLPPAPAPAVQAVGSSNAGAARDTIGDTPGLATLPAGASPGSHPEPDPTLSANVAKLFNTNESNVSVSFQIEKNPNEIVTVFTDKQTGKVIVQFPSETLVALAQFFDKLDGSVVNKKV